MLAIGKALVILSIPILNLSEPVVPADPYKNYLPIIENNVAQATGTSNNLAYLFTHSNRGRAIFANLDFLTENDTIVYNLKKYYVTGKKIVVETDLSPIKQQPKKDTLILQTCLTNGNLTKRLIVTAKLKDQLALK